MDLSMLETLIPNLAGYFNLQPSTVLLILVAASTLANLVGRRIPDDATGWQGFVRDVCKLLGFYMSNRVSTGIKTSDVIKGVVGVATVPMVQDAIREMANQPDALIPEVVEDQASEEIVQNSFGRFLENHKPEEENNA